MNAQNSEHFNGQPLKIIVNQAETGGWKSSVEVDLGRTGCIVFEDSGQTYPSEEEAREAVLALAVQNLGKSRLVTKKS